MSRKNKKTSVKLEAQPDALNQYNDTRKQIRKNYMAFPFCFQWFFLF